MPRATARQLSNEGKKAMSKKLGLSEITPKSNWGIIKAVYYSKLKITARYKGMLLMSIFLPILFSILPVFFGIAVAGSGAQAAQNFQNNTGMGGHGGTANYQFFMLLGGCTFSIVVLMMWDVGFWIRDEQLTGTLESLYLAPSKRFYVVCGVTLFSVTESVLIFFTSLGIGCALFQINPFSGGSLFIAAAFLFVGIMPLFGIAFIFGSLVLKIKEAGSLINLMQFVISFFMGVFYPISILPRYLRYISYAFPPSWLTNGLRASLLDLSYFLDAWYLDVAVLAVFCFLAPLFGYMIFKRTETTIRRNEGIGQY